MSDVEREEFFREAAAAIYLKGWLVAKLGLDPDTTTAKQIESRMVAILDWNDTGLARIANLERELDKTKEDLARAQRIAIYAHSPLP